MYCQKRSRLSQNFLYDSRLVAKLIRLSSIGKKDFVLEIGPGKGIITQPLLDKANIVLGIELDYRWCNHLRKRFKNQFNFLLYQGNFLEFPLPLSQYKVFANLPFAIEGKAIRKLIEAKNPPEDCCLVIRKELAIRLTGKEKDSYQKFIKLGFGQGLSIYQNLAKKLEKYQTKQILKRQDISLKTKPGGLTLKQWLNLYLDVKKCPGPIRFIEIKS